MSIDMVLHSMSRKVLGGFMNCSEHNTKSESELILKTRLDESLFTVHIHRIVARAINKVKESGAEVCDLNVLAFLERHGIPRTLEEEQELLAIQSEYAITYNSFRDYIKELQKQKSLKVAI